MTTGLDHPAISSYLARLADVARAQGLPPGRREELLGEIRGHIADALAASTGPTDVAVASLLDRLGPAEEIVAAELTDRSASPASPASPVTAVASAPVPGPGPAGARWGALEIVAVVGLVVGSYVLPVIGTLIGLGCAWLSPRWTTRQKSIATALSVLPLLLLTAGAAALFAGSSVSSTVPVPAVPVVSSIPISPAPAGSLPEVTP